MKFTIGAISNIQQYEEDLKLIKSSLLYADDIELIGLAEYLTFIYLPRVFDSKKDVFELVDEIVPFLRSANSPLQKESNAAVAPFFDEKKASDYCGNSSAAKT